MAISQIMVPFRNGYDIGIGATLASGSPMGKVVDGEITGVTDAVGAVVDFQVQRILSTSDLETALGVDVEASYGCASFGAGISARFNFAKKSKIQTSSLFMSVTATVELAFKQIDDPLLTRDAGEIIEMRELFHTRYGNMFVRGLSTGGIFVGVLRIDTGSSEESETIAAEMEGSYGLFSAEAKVKFEEIQRKYRNEISVRMYHEGGPVDLRITNPQDPVELLNNANRFLESFASRPGEVARPYAATLAPVEIARGPLPPNPADVQKRQDILVLCAKRRSTLLDQLNLLDYVKANPSKFDFTNGADPESMRKAARDAELDLDFIAECASAAMNSATEADFPAAVAERRGEPFPRVVMPDPMPLPKSGKVVLIPDFSGCSSWTSCDEVAVRAGLTVKREIAAGEPGDFKVLGFLPPKDTPVAEGSQVTIITHPVKNNDRWALDFRHLRYRDNIYYRPLNR